MPHAWQLRDAIRKHVPELVLGGWANPHAPADEQIGYLNDDHFFAEYFLTQIVSHHDAKAVEAFATQLEKRQVAVPGVFGVFYYRSANPKTLNTLRQFLPVPIEGLTRDFSSGASPEEVCARTIRLLRDVGVRHVYVSNLPAGKARATLAKIQEAVAAGL